MNKVIILTEIKNIKKSKRETTELRNTITKLKKKSNRVVVRDSRAG